MSSIIRTFIIIIISCFFSTNVQCLDVPHLNSSTEEEHDLSHEFDVLVLGAGLSGIGAAIKLHENEVDNFLVLEAKDYIGGRLRETRFYGETIAMGAGWIHNIESNHKMYQLAKKYKLQTSLDSYAFDKISFRHGIFGYIFNKWYVNNNDRILKTGLNKCVKFCEKAKRTGDFYHLSFRQCLQQSGWDISWIKKEKLREAIDFFMFDFENAGQPEKQSAWQISYTGEGHDLVVTDPRGYNYPLVQEIKPFKDKFVLNTEIKSIIRSKSSKYTITTTNGRIYNAKHVIVSFSSGVLLAERVQFAPKLPPWKTEALKYVPMGHYCKYFFKFPYQFWNSNVTYFILGTKIRGNYGHWQNMNQAHLFPGSNIMLCTLTGNICKEKEKLSDEVVIQEAMKILRIQRDFKNAPDPIEIKRSKWSTDPHVLGSYSLPAPGITPKHYLALEHPIRKSLWFTGEYANVDAFGYTHGAYSHGELIGERVAKCLLHNVCPEEKPADVK